MGGQRHAPAALPPGKTRYPLYRRLGVHEYRSGQVRKMSSPPTEIRFPYRPVRSKSVYRLTTLPLILILILPVRSKSLYRLTTLPLILILILPVRSKSLYRLTTLPLILILMLHTSHLFKYYFQFILPAHVF